MKLSKVPDSSPGAKISSAPPLNGPVPLSSAFRLLASIQELKPVDSTPTRL